MFYHFLIPFDKKTNQFAKELNLESFDLIILNTEIFFRTTCGHWQLSIYLHRKKSKIKTSTKRESFLLRQGFHHRHPQNHVRIWIWRVAVRFHSSILLTMIAFERTTCILTSSERESFSMPFYLENQFRLTDIIWVTTVMLKFLSLKLSRECPSRWFLNLIAVLTGGCQWLYDGSA